MLEIKSVSVRDPLGLIERAGALTQLISSAEYLVDTSNRRRGGLNDWNLLRSQFPSPVSQLWDRLDAKESERVYQGLHVLRISHNALLLSPVKNNVIRGYCNLVQVASYLALQPRQFFGTDGSDQLCFLSNCAAGIGRIGNSPVTIKAASDFIALQVIISYLISGIVKAPGKRWAQGDALEKVMATQTYGDKTFYEFIVRRPRIGRYITKGTVLIESLMPLALINSRILKCVLTIFGSFHLANAKTMGLGRFVLPFVATYPAMLQLQKSMWTIKGES